MAAIFEPCVRETSATTGTGDIVLAGRMWGSLSVASVMANGDTADFVIRYGDTFEEVNCTYVSATNKLVRGTVYRSHHLVGTVDQNHVSFAAGIKTVIMTYASGRVAALPALAAGALRFDIAQSLSSGQSAQARANAPPFAAGTKMLFMQTSAPTGWTKDTTHNDKALRIVSGTPSSGGFVDFSTVFSRISTDLFTLTTAQVPAYTPTGTVTSTFSSGITGAFGVSGINTTPGGLSVFNTGTGAALAVTGAVGSTFAGNAQGGTANNIAAGIDMRVKFADVIAATKD